MTHSWAGIAFLALLLLAPIAQAASTATTLFTFRVPATRSLSVAYGGSCSASAFFFNEIDANFDPDVDGNAAKVKPSAVRNTATYTTTDYNFVGVIGPSDRNRAYFGNLLEEPSTSNSQPAGEIDDVNYHRLTAEDLNYYFAGNTTTRWPSLRLAFKANPHELTIRDLNLTYVGAATRGVGCDIAGAFVNDSDFNGWIWNFRTGAYERVFTHDGDNGLASDEIIPWRVDAFIDYNITDYVDDDQNIVFLIQGQRKAGGATECLVSDFAELKITHYPLQTQYCQSETVAPFTITNNGNVDVNVDGNFASAFAGSDVNVVLKVWMGTGTGCGNTGYGGWEGTCSVTSTTSPVTQTQCKNYNEHNETTASRLVTKLVVGDTNQLCFSGDFNVFVSGGDHNQNFQAGVLYS